eukprot:705193-Rhodomonas_salina.3
MRRTGILGRESLYVRGSGFLSDRSRDLVCMRTDARIGNGAGSFRELNFSTLGARMIFVDIVRRSRATSQLVRAQMSSWMRMRPKISLGSVLSLQHG